MPRAGLTIHLVRHGRSTWNDEGRLQGQTVHPPLTTLGEQQATAAAHHLIGAIGSAPVTVISSDLVRASQTAAVIASALGAAVRLDPALREQALGVMEGVLSRDLTPQETPKGAHVSEIRWGGGESIEDVHRRVGAFFDRELRQVRADSLHHLVLISHGDTIRVMDAWLRGRGHREVDWDLTVANGEVLTVVP